MANPTSVLCFSMIGGMIYATIIAVTALAAVFASTPARRRAAREVLKILLFRNKSDT